MRGHCLRQQKRSTASRLPAGEGDRNTGARYLRPGRACQGRARSHRPLQGRRQPLGSPQNTALGYWLRPPEVALPYWYVLFRASLVAPAADLVRLSRTSIADEMREEHRRQVLGE